MQYQTKIRRLSLTAFSFLILMINSNPIMAQVGSMDYEPSVYNSVPAIPVGGGIFMLILGALLGIAAFWKISRSGISGNKAVAVFLTLGAVTFTLSGGQVLQQAIADNTTSLSNPNGGTVDVYSDYQEYVNASGVPLVITAVNGPCNIPAAQKAKDGGQGVQADSKTQAISLPYCESGLALEENGDRCYTYFLSCDF